MNAPQPVVAAWKTIGRELRRAVAEFMFDQLVEFASPALGPIAAFLNSGRRNVDAADRVPIAVLHAFWGRCAGTYAKVIQRFGALQQAGMMRDPASDWPSLLPLFRQILRSLERHGQEQDVQGTPMFGSFGLLPLFSAKRKFVALDEASLAELSNHLQLGPAAVPAGAPFSGGLFDLSRVHLGAQQGGGVLLIRQILTNGVGASVVVVRSTGQPPRRLRQGQRLAARTLDDPPLPNIPQMADPRVRYVGIDPGKRWMFYGAVRGANGVEGPGVRCSSREYGELSGIAGGERRERRWQEEEPEIAEWAEAAPPQGHGTVAGMSNRLYEELPRMDMLLGFYGQKR